MMGRVSLHAGLIAMSLLCGCAAGRNDRVPHPPAADGFSASVVARTRADVVESTAPWSFGGREGKSITTAHYRIWTTEADAVIVARLPLFLEQAMNHYRGWLGDSRGRAGPILPPPNDRLDTFVMASRPQWELLTRQLLGERAGIYLRIPRGGYAWAGRSVLYNIGAQGTMAIAAHEGWHQYTQRTFKESLPIWLEEGIATYMEGHRWGGPSGSGIGGGTPVFMGWANINRFDQLRSAAGRGQLLSLGQLLTTTPDQLLGPQGATPWADDSALTFYAQVWALVHFLNEGAEGRYRAGLERLLLDTAAGRMERTVIDSAAEGISRGRMMGLRVGPAVFQAYFNESIGEAEREFAEFQRELVKPGSRGAIAEGVSPFEPVSVK